MKKLSPAFLFILFLASSQANSMTVKAIDNNLFKSQKWLNMLHYRSKLFGGYESEVDSKSFFVHPEGRVSPKAELESFVRSLINPTQKEHLKNPTHCRFPMRAKWIQSKLQNITLDYSICPKYQEFKKYMMPKSVYLVFSSYYLESPASAFGHTFLRFSRDEKARDGKNSELLDLGINYGANPTTKNPFMYGILGMIGGFKGVFSKLPYFYKIREYNNHESRDLWSYKLNLNQKHVEALVDHLWEIGGTFSYYYFFTENCSYKVLAILDAVNPKWNLLSHLPFYVIPVDTIKAFNQVPGLLGEYHYRASVKKVFVNSHAHLTSSEEDVLEEMVETKSIASAIAVKDEKAKTNILDTYMDYLDYKHSAQMQAKKGEFYDLKQKALGQRVDLPPPFISRDVATPHDQRPDIGHSSKRLSLLAGHSESLKDFAQVKFRFALHDFLDPVAGQPEFAAIEFGSVTLRHYSELESTQVEEIKMVEIETLNPVSFLEYPMSLNAKVAATRQRDKTCNNCLAPQITFAGGISFLRNQDYIFTAYLHNSISIDTDYIEDRHKISSGPRLQFLGRWTDKFRQRTQFLYQRHFLQKKNYWQLLNEVRYDLGKKYSLTWEAQADDLEFSTNFGLLIYL